MNSITDQPILSSSEDLLKVEKYSQALSNFIGNSETPITIGLQGEWGTGKTSLMSLLLEDFSRDGREVKIATSWVNTWEYSMFKGAHETTPGVLRGMLEKLKESCKDRGVWTLADGAKDRFGKATRFLGGLANQVLANQTGLNVKDAASGVSDKTKYLAEIAEIKALIAGLIQELIDDSKNPVEKVVFFVDDLDRIPPSDAVEVLESLKNIFDIPNCVFLLAIDYEVVVKGLESKFGPKTESNEREFRSFFDKIIQVPFSMPVGTYDIENFLVEKLKKLEVEIDETNRELFTKAVRFTIGSNPRSLKRYLNSFSLINDLKAIEFDTDQEAQGDDFMLFALLGIQISYPNIFRLLTQSSDFTKWDRGFANKFGVEWTQIEEQLEKFGEHDLIDEEWERVVWGACQKDPYIKAKAFSILELLNLLRDRYKETLIEQIDAAMAFASITSVDDDVESKQAVQKIGNKTVFNGIAAKVNQLEEAGISNEGLDNYKTLWNILDGGVSNNKSFRISFTKTATSFNDDRNAGRGNKQVLYCPNPSKKESGIKIWIKRNYSGINELENEIKQIFNLENTSLLSKLDDGDLFIGPGLQNELGPQKYKELLEAIASRIIT